MDRNTVIAFFLIALVIFLWPLYTEYVLPQPPPSKTTTTAPREAPTTPPYNPTSVPERTQVRQYEPEELTAESALPEANESFVTIDHPLYEAVISNKNGGSITSFKLKNYQKFDSTMVELINGENYNNLLLSFISALDGQKTNLDNLWYTDNTLEIINVNQVVDLSFYTFYNDQKIEKKLVFNPDCYKIGIKTNLASITAYVSQGLFSIGWPNGLPSTEKNTKDDLTYFKGYAFLGDDLHTPRAKNELKMERLLGQTNWVAVRSKYFITALIPEQPAPSAEIGGIVKNGEKAKHNIFSVVLYQNSQAPSLVNLYLGPLEYQRVKGLGVDLDKVMNFGWSFIRPIAKGVLYLLSKMHKSIPNYGIVLIIFAVLVKILVYPLTKKSHQSTKEMQAVQPLVAELKEKYKNNPTKLNQETMALYKEHGVNPLGGCLPLLLQMPLLLALFQVFRSTIELRGAHFVGWITDLSSPDTIFYLPFTIPIYGDQISVLPLVMGVSMFIQQKMMPTQASGQQKYMSYFMTGFFILLFNNFPSGLNLYYTLFNVLTILQQKYLTPQPPAPVITAGQGKKAGKTRKK